ncbi:MAG: DUF1428 domain-containing protein [Hyphomonas sp.]|uniref:DUF1428 domain-containing protein n=1 Tax=Hyphomonas sp. TaxID=87 RepID=UPI0035276371
MAYVDGFLLAVPDANKEAYRAMAEQAAAVFRKHGATQVMECWGEDVPDGVVTSFPLAVKLAPGETVVFSWIVWPSRAVRDAGHPVAMQEFEDMGLQASHLFDGKRMVFGGFDVMVDA